MRIIIDGYNLLFAADLVPDTFQALEEARQKLIDLLTQYNRRRKHRINVIFDAGGKTQTGIFQELGQTVVPAGLVSKKNTDIKITFTPSNKDADTLITEYVVNDSRPTDILVVSSDKTIRNALRSTKAKLVKTDEFLKELGIPGGRVSKKRSDSFEPPEKTLGIPKSEVTGWLEVFGFEKEEK